MSNIIITGLNGYGNHFVRELLQDDNNELIAVVSGAPEKSELYGQLMERGVRFYRNIESCLEEEKPDMAIICTPMHIHFQEVKICLEKGVSVYCEKPLTTTVDSLLEIQKLAKAKGAMVAVGFQWSFSEGIRNLKQDILDDKYGKLKSIKTLVNWVRPVSYYKNSNWKGRNTDSTGNIIFDNIASNGAAHHLHNMLFLSGAEMTKALDVSAASYEVKAYKAHNIETFDTLSLKMEVDDLQIGFWGTLVSDSVSPVEFEAICEEAKIIYPYDEDNHIAAIGKDGTVTLYENPEKERYVHYQKVAKAIEDSGTISCDMHTVEPFQCVIEYLRLHADVKDFDKADIIMTEDSVVVKGLSEKLRKAYLNEVILEGM